MMKKYKCFQCGKEFYNNNMKHYMFKQKINRGSKTIYFCGWNCMREYEKERDLQSWMKK